jgi:hypothetical protein
MSEECCLSGFRIYVFGVPFMTGKYPVTELAVDDEMAELSFRDLANEIRNYHQTNCGKQGKSADAVATVRGAIEHHFGKSVYDGGNLGAQNIRNFVSNNREDLAYMFGSLSDGAEIEDIC